MLITFYELEKVRIHNKCIQVNLKNQRADTFFSIFHIWVYDKTTGYFIKRKNFEGLLFKALNTTEHFKIPLLSLPLLPSPIVVIHKALRYKLTCSVDHIIGQVILICCRVGGRVGKDTKRSLKEKSIELIIQNIWNWTDLGLGVYEKFSWNFLGYDWLIRGPILVSIREN